MKYLKKHLLGLEGVPKEDLQHILETAKYFREILDRPIKKVPTLTGVTIVNLFFESSTRTRISFELAEKRLSADLVNFSASTSSVSKGETLKDTARNIEAMMIDMVVMRHAHPGSHVFLTQVLDSSIINAGDGCHEHPTQGLLDMYSLQEQVGNLEGVKVVIIGDISHSRVALSNIHGMTTMGVEVAVCGPATLIPVEIEKLGVKVFYSLEEALNFADVLMVLRIQLERQQWGAFPSLREYHNLFGITGEKLAQFNKEFVIMHPGPINRGVEIDSDIADSKHSIILRQVTNGVAIRMAVLYLLSGREV